MIEESGEGRQATWYQDTLQTHFRPLTIWRNEWNNQQDYAAWPMQFCWYPGSSNCVAMLILYQELVFKNDMEKKMGPEEKDKWEKGEFGIAEINKRKGENGNLLNKFVNHAEERPDLYQHMYLQLGYTQTETERWSTND